jgi:hypothetical protein
MKPLIAGGAGHAGVECVTTGNEPFVDDFSRQRASWRRPGGIPNNLRAVGDAWRWQQNNQPGDKS